MFHVKRTPLKIYHIYQQRCTIVNNRVHNFAHQHLNTPTKYRALLKVCALKIGGRNIKFMNFNPAVNSMCNMFHNNIDIQL